MIIVGVGDATLMLLVIILVRLVFYSHFPANRGQLKCDLNHGDLILIERERQVV